MFCFFFQAEGGIPSRGRLTGFKPCALRFGWVVKGPGIRVGTQMGGPKQAPGGSLAGKTQWSSQAWAWVKIGLAGSWFFLFSPLHSHNIYKAMHKLSITK